MGVRVGAIGVWSRRPVVGRVHTHGVRQLKSTDSDTYGRFGTRVTCEERGGSVFRDSGPVQTDVSAQMSHGNAPHRCVTRVRIKDQCPVVPTQVVDDSAYHDGSGRGVCGRASLEVQRFACRGPEPPRSLGSKVVDYCCTKGDTDVGEDRVPVASRQEERLTGGPDVTLLQRSVRLGRDGTS